MADVGEVRYKAVVDNSGIDTEIKKTEKCLGGLDDPIKKTSSKFSGLGKVGVTALKGIGTAFVGLASAAGAGVAAVAKMGIEYNAQMQSYQTAFTTMLGSAEKAQKLTDDLKEMAAATPLAMTDLADASQILLAFGSSAEELPDQLKRLGDVAQGDAQALGTMATAFGRIQSNGYASLEEINMMIDQGFNPLNIIAEQTGETMAEVRDRVSAGEVSFEELSNALQIATDEGGQFFNAMQNQSETFEGQMSTLEDNLSALAGALTEDLFGSLAENTLPQVNTWVDELMTAAEEGGVEGAIEASGSILTEMITSLLNGAPQVIETATSLVQSFLGSVRENGPEIMEGAIGVVMNLIEGFIDSIPELIDSAAVLIAAFLSGIDLGQVLEMGIRLVFAIVEGKGLDGGEPERQFDACQLRAAQECPGGNVRVAGSREIGGGDFRVSECIGLQRHAIGIGQPEVAREVRIPERRPADVSDRIRQERGDRTQGRCIVGELFTNGFDAGGEHDIGERCRVDCTIAGNGRDSAFRQIQRGDPGAMKQPSRQGGHLGA